MKHKNLQCPQGRQVIKYSRREAAQFDLTKIPEINLNFCLIVKQEAVNSFLNTLDFSNTAMECMLLKRQIKLKQGSLHRFISTFLV